MDGSRRGLFAVLAALALLAIQLASAAFAAPGDVVADVITPEGGGLLWARSISPSVAFDGSHLYYTEYAGSILHRIDVPPAGGPTPATGIVDVPITGSLSGIMTIAYDRGRDLFWAVGGNGTSIYTLTKSGVASLAFTIGPEDRPGFQSGIFAVEVKIAYDRADDSIWYSPDATSRIYHYRTTPDALGTADPVPATPWVDVDVTAQCGYNQSSGVATGGTSLFVTVTGCPFFFEYSKTGTKLAWYPVNYAGQQSTQDAECDDTSYAVPVLWIKDGYASRIRAYELPVASCALGGGL
ncbi:MAG TPA: hypothetical protein VJQ09_02460 [Candidatus Limnocylindria bacterium]|nr:hypothetical protein [Candidatus Limnocylindria bacterium]